MKQRIVEYVLWYHKRAVTRRTKQIGRVVCKDVESTSSGDDTEGERWTRPHIRRLHRLRWLLLTNLISYNPLSPPCHTPTWILDHRLSHRCPCPGEPLGRRPTTCLHRLSILRSLPHPTSFKAWRCWIPSLTTPPLLTLAVVSTRKKKRARRPTRQRA